MQFFALTSQLDVSSKAKQRHIMWDLYRQYFIAGLMAQLL